MRLFPLLLLLLTSASEFSPALPLAAYGAYAARIPEHTCHKLIGFDKCDLDKCIKECSKELYGEGDCKGTICLCTYYCKQPPV